MQNRRRPPAQITPLNEDAGLFKKGVQQITLHLLPSISRNNRDDLVVRSLTVNDTAVEVVFAGRRARAAAALEHRLERMQVQAARSAVAGGRAAPAAAVLRLPVTMEGAWRLRFQPDASGWEIRSYQFLAARWAFTDACGKPVHFGQPPLEPPKPAIRTAAEESRGLTPAGGR